MFRKQSGVIDLRMIFNTALALLVTFQTIYGHLLSDYANDIVLRTLTFGTLAINIIWSKREMFSAKKDV